MLIATFLILVLCSLLTGAVTLALMVIGAIFFDSPHTEHINGEINEKSNSSETIG